VAENLWALREQKKISVATLASRAGLPIGLIMEYESGQRSVEPKHLSRIARALYIEESDIKMRSDPRPGAVPLERRTNREALREPMPRPPAPPPRSREKLPRPKPEPQPPAPARPSQIAHLHNLLQRLRRSADELEAELGKPIAELDRPTISTLLGRLQKQIQESASISVNRHRAYLPESVDEFEAAYLMACQKAGDLLQFTLFDGSKVEGQIIGFSPYTITVRQADESELTLNKLALVCYQKLPTAASVTAGEEPIA
jgi:transcriptional regulator with XRE-family HTH domain